MPAPALEPTLPGAQILHVVNVASRWNVDAAAILAGTGLTLEALKDPNLRLPLSSCVKLLARTRELTSEPALGVYLGLATRATVWGYLGLATLSAKNLRAALELAVQFAPIVTPAFSLELRERGDHAELLVEEQVTLGDVRDVAVLATVIGLRNVGVVLTGQPSTAAIEVALPRPAYAARIASVVPALSFERARHRLSFGKAALELPCVQHDPVALRMLVEQCERMLDSTASAGPLAKRVRSLLRAHGSASPRLQDLATQVGMSTRTFKRKLAGESITFRELVEEELYRRACELLPRDLTIAQVALRLDYSNTANFERAFRRWTGQTPAAYRKRPPTRPK